MKRMNWLRGIALPVTTLFAISADATDVLVENAFLPGAGAAKGELVSILISEGRIQPLVQRSSRVMLKGSALAGRLSHQGISIRGRAWAAEVSGLGTSRDGRVEEVRNAAVQCLTALNEGSSLIPFAPTDGVTRGVITPLSTRLTLRARARLCGLSKAMHSWRRRVLLNTCTCESGIDGRRWIGGHALSGAG